MSRELQELEAACTDGGFTDAAEAERVSRWALNRIRDLEAELERVKAEREHDLRRANACIQAADALADVVRRTTGRLDKEAQTLRVNALRTYRTARGQRGGADAD